MSSTAKSHCRTTGGKGNIGHFIERDPRICAAGIPTRQASLTIADAMQRYNLQDEVDALLSDSIFPKPTPKRLPPLCHKIPLDMRFAGPYGEVATLINPPMKTKVQQLAEDLKETTYRSYWKQVVGKVSDPVPMLPEGMDVYKTTFGKKIPFEGRLYDIVMPPVPLPDKTPKHEQPGVQKVRCYFSPPFDPNLTYGCASNIEKGGKYVKCALTDDRNVQGTDLRTVLHHIQADFQETHRAERGLVLAPNNNISMVPEGYSFGKLQPPDSINDILCYCKLNKHLLDYRKFLKHLNTLRISLSKRFLPIFFLELYRNFKYMDKKLMGWLPKETVYDFCGIKLIRFDPKLMEPLLSMWKAFDGSNIEYKIFVHVINYRAPIEDLPRVQDIPRDCLDFRTTYSEMIRPGQGVDRSHPAGLASFRADLDFPSTPMGTCRADKIALMEESNVKSRLAPSVMQLMNVSHRDMYERRDQCTVRRVFEGAGSVLTNEQFCTIWEEAAKRHPEGWVCYETFRRTLEEFNSNSSKNKKS